MESTGLNSRVAKLEKDMYYGEGKDNPPMTTRMALMESVVEKINKNLSKIVWLMIATLISVVVKFFVK